MGAAPGGFAWGQVAAVASRQKAEEGSSGRGRVKVGGEGSRCGFQKTDRAFATHVWELLVFLRPTVLENKVPL